MKGLPLEAFGGRIVGEAPEEPVELSPQQVRVCVLTAAGETDAAIGRTLGISHRTVQMYQERASRRLLDACPWIPHRTPKKVIRTYYVAFAGVAAFVKRTSAEEEEPDP